MNGRYSPRRVPPVVLSCLLLTGCGLFGGDGSGGGTVTPSAEPLPSVAWESVEREQVAAGGTLRIGVAGLPENFNPDHASNSDTDVTTLLAPTRGSAVRIRDDGRWEVDPHYARAVDVVSRSPLRVRVRLNREAVWQGGMPITVDDMVAYVGAHDGSDPKYQVSSTRGFDAITAVERGDDDFEYTVTFDEPLADWPRFIYPALPKAVSSRPGRFNERFVDRAVPSNGPYVVRSIDRKAGRVVMAPNHRWWGEAPRLDRIVWQAADPTVQVAALQADELDVVSVRPADRGTLDDLRTDSARVQVSAGTEWTQLTMNGGRGPLRDVKVRRAVARALDRPALAALSTAGLDVAPTLQGSFVLLPGQVGYRDGSGELERDLDEAAELLDEAGWTLPKGGTIRKREDKKLALTMPVPARTRSIVERAELIAAQLKQVGIAVELESVPDQRYYPDRIVPLDFDLATFSHVGSAFPVVESAALFHPVDSAQNFTGIDPKGMGRLWERAVRSLSDKDRVRAVRDIDERLFSVVPMVPLGVVPEIVVVRADVVNIGAAQFRRPDWTRVGFRADDAE